MQLNKVPLNYIIQLQTDSAVRIEVLMLSLFGEFLNLKNLI